MIELAFFRAFLGLEGFLEESFVLYVLGKRPQRGRTPHRFVLPPNRAAAVAMLTEGRDYAKWDSAGLVSSRAERYFRDGRPYAHALRPAQHTLDGAKTIRNAVAHESSGARDKFETLARRELQAGLPPNLTVGSFLNTTKPGSAPPISFLDFYLDLFQIVAEQIIPP